MVKLSGSREEWNKAKVTFPVGIAGWDLSLGLRVVSGCGCFLPQPPASMNFNVVLLYVMIEIYVF